ncbi:maleylpyruvate isomerase family mycothiol-dependent enzyme [Nocardioides cynanchi]|uniref:maleylpyruvate isomerase family mycothiol-dependent enzyme n=1 Tax=Nocardioides cynanchi TaxID=2558918 RepID=UPI001EE37C50|nr:maleylpyruvate isomerase family mycothiol-dependent enzyme [Nocardioides cynanchi]
MDVERHLAGVRRAVDAFAAAVAEAGLAASVPTTPDWDVRRLVAHQGLVHRWATATVVGETIDDEAIEREGMDAEDPVAWLRAGAERLVETLADAPDDLQALVFLADAPAPREFWARRQCHETTIHAVDALAAALGRYPRAADTWLEPDLALDGIDELLTGFLPRPRSRLRTPEPTTVAVLPDDAAERWLVTVTERPPTTERGAGDDGADVVLRGSAVALYLTLWNRSDEVEADGFGLWADGARVSWS